MKTLKYYFYFTISFSLLIGSIVFTSCNKEDDNEPDNTDYSNILPGHWAKKDWMLYDILETYSFDPQGPGTIVVEYIDYNDTSHEFGEASYLASGNYVIHGNEISVYFKNVYSKLPAGTNGFTNNQSCRMSYTIESYKDGVLTIRDSNNRIVELVNGERN